GRAAGDGIVWAATSDDGKSGVVVEVNCETDFVSKNDDFKAFVQQAAKLALQHKTTTVEELGKVKMPSGEAVQEYLTNMVARIGENMQLRRVAFLNEPNGTVASYIHLGGKIGTLVSITGLTGDKADEAAKDIAMHTAASMPRYLKSED